MTPGARVAAAIAILDGIGAKASAEQALAGWARASRFAGSKDRAAVRDLVFDALRARRSLGDGDGRALMLQLALREGWDVAALFNGQGHAPAAPDSAELTPAVVTGEAVQCDLPDWIWPLWCDSLGEDARPAAMAQQMRAPVFVRVNLRCGTRLDAAASLGAEGIATTPHPHVATCLRIDTNARRLKASQAYLAGLVELQDASSQWAVAAVPLAPAARVLDYCAGGGGKALAFADRGADVTAHDIAPVRMRDLPARAGRAGVAIETVDTDSLAKTRAFDVVFCDAPCSGSGTWRRTPDAKWRFDAARLAALMQSQDEVLSKAAAMVGSGGVLAYATCSVLKDENQARIAAFLARKPQWTVVFQERRLPDPWGDGFFLAVLRRGNTA